MQRRSAARVAGRARANEVMPSEPPPTPKALTAAGTPESVATNYDRLAAHLPEVVRAQLDVLMAESSIGRDSDVLESLVATAYLRVTLRDVPAQVGGERKQLLAVADRVGDFVSGAGQEIGAIFEAAKRDARGAADAVIRERIDSVHAAEATALGSFLTSARVAIEQLKTDAAKAGAAAVTDVGLHRLRLMVYGAAGASALAIAIIVGMAGYVIGIAMPKTLSVAQNAELRKARMYEAYYESADAQTRKQIRVFFAAHEPDTRAR